MTKQKKPKHEIKLLILDVDGVLTDGKLYLSDDGIETKIFHVHDGFGLRLLLNNGINVAIISGRKSKATKKRLRELGIKHAYLGVSNKDKPFVELKKKLQIKNENIAYIGDDLPDLSVMQKAGFSIAVANAVEQIRKIADYTTKAKGGEGAVREACEMILNHKF
jgi:3-deoxy-D-manno-octulosonate 8-phosphate phosphatase (KDO 8-P phosphatase)